jgi:hypothetical protein
MSELELKHDADGDRADILGEDEAQARANLVGSSSSWISQPPTHVASLATSPTVPSFQCLIYADPLNAGVQARAFCARRQ